MDSAQHGDPVFEMFLVRWEEWGKGYPDEDIDFAIKLRNWIFKEIQNRRKALKPDETRICKQSEIIREHIDKLAQELGITAEVFIEKVFPRNEKKRINFFTGKPIYGAIQ